MLVARRVQLEDGGGAHQVSLKVPGTLHTKADCGEYRP